MRRVVLALVLLLSSVVTLAVVAPGLANAAETHTNCIQFDQDGNVIGLTPDCSQTLAQAGGPTQSFPGANPCDPTDTGVVTLVISRQVYHINVDGAGDAWDTGTFTGAATFVPDNTGDVSGSGTFTNWFGDDFNARNMVQTFTLDVVVHLPDGQTATVHLVGSVTITATGAVMTVFKPSSSCS